MSEPIIYTAFGGGISGLVTGLLLRPANEFTCEGGMGERQNILGTPEQCVNALGSDVLGLVGALDPLIAAGVVGMAFFFGGWYLQSNKAT